MPMWLRVAIMIGVSVLWGFYMIPQAYDAVINHHGAGPPYVLWAVPGVTWIFLSGRAFIFNKSGIHVEAEKRKKNDDSPNEKD